MMASLSCTGILTLASLAKRAGLSNPRKSQGSSVWRVPGPSLTFFPLSCLGPLFWGGMALSAWVGGQRGGAWVTGLDRRSCVSVSVLGGQGRGPCLGKVWVPLAVEA